MLKLKQLVDFVPDTSSLVKDMLLATAEYPKEIRKMIQQHVEEQMRDIDNNRKLSNPEKFKVFIGKFLYVQVRSEKAEKVMEYISSRFNTPADLAKADAATLASKFRQMGYRFPDKARVLIEISKILQKRFDGEIDDYIAFVDTHYTDDPVLNVKGVGFKTRDIALSSFTKNYSLVDVHISNVLSRTGLILKAYLYGFKLTTDRTNESNYLEMTKLLSKLSTEAGMMPFEFDQTLWFFGKDYCSPMKCEKCSVQKCVTRDFKDIIP